MKKTWRARDIAQDAGQVELLLQHGTGGLLEWHAEFLGDDGGERGLAQSRRAVEQHVVHGFAALPGRFDRDREVLFELGLAGEIGEPPRAQPGLELALVFLRRAPKRCRGRA